MAGLLPEGVVDPLPGPIEAPEPEVMVHRLPGWAVVREVAPGTAAPENIADGVQGLPSFSRRTSAALGRRDERLQDGAFGIGEVGGIGTVLRWHRVAPGRG